MRVAGSVLCAAVGAFALAVSGCSLLRKRPPAPVTPPPPPVAQAVLAAPIPSPSAGIGLGTPVDRVIATVDGNPITMVDVKAFAAAAGKPMPAAGPARAAEMHKALKALIEEKMLEQEVKKYRDKVDDSQVDAYVAQIKKKTGLNDAQFNAELEHNGITPQQFRKEARMQLEKAAMVQDEVRSRINIPPAQIEAYYHEHSSQFMVKDKRVRLEQILIAVPPKATPEQIAAARAKAESIRKRALAGEDFASLARQYSDDASRTKGGELGWFKPSEVMDQIAAAVAPLKPGQISQVVRSSHGFHILKLEDRQMPGPVPLAQVKDAIREHLLNQATKAQFQHWVEHDLIKQHDVELLD